MSTTTDIERHQQLMNFMTDFRSSVTEQIKATNDKIDSKLDVINSDMEEMKAQISDNETRSIRMDNRLILLEEQMKKSATLKENREKNRAKEMTGKPPDTTELNLRPSGKTFERRTITPIDLTSESTDRPETRQPSFKSLWAKAMEEELIKAARAGATGREYTGKPSGNTQETRTDNFEHQERTGYYENPAARKETQEWNSTNWEGSTQEIMKKPPPKIRKPPNDLKDWFGDKSEEEEYSSSSSENTEDDTGEPKDSWKEIQRTKKKQDKMKKRKDRREGKNGTIILQNATYDRTWSNYHPSGRILH